MYLLFVDLLYVSDIVQCVHTAAVMYGLLYDQRILCYIICFIFMYVIADPHVHSMCVINITITASPYVQRQRWARGPAE